MTTEAVNVASKKKVLIVDDEPAIVQLFFRAFRRHFDVLTAESGAEALALLEGIHDLDLLVVDFAMPGMSGVEVAKRVSVRMPHTVCILATAHFDLPEVKGALADGVVVEVIHKPWLLREVLARLQFWSADSSAVDHASGVNAG